MQMQGTRIGKHVENSNRSQWPKCSAAMCDYKEKRLLLVGEGNFSFSASLVSNSNHHIIATCMKNDKECSELHQANIKLIVNQGGKVYTDVDATCISSHPVIGNHIFDQIIFNFPHRPGKMKIGDNRKLLRSFFVGAVEVLHKHGEVQVSLCRGQSGTPVDENPRKWEDSWQIVELAASADLVLRDVRPFFAKDYPGYKPSGFRGCGKSFNIEGAFTFIFCKAESLPEFSDLVVNYEKQSDYLQPMLKKWIENQKLFEELLLRNSPVKEYASSLLSEFCKLDQMTVMLSCKDPFSCDIHDQHIINCDTGALNLSAFGWFILLISSFYPEHKHNSSFLLPFIFLPNLHSNNVLCFKPYLIYFLVDGAVLINGLQKVLSTVASQCDEINPSFTVNANSNSIKWDRWLIKDSSLCENVHPLLTNGLYVQCFKDNCGLIVASFTESCVLGYKMYRDVKIDIIENANLLDTLEPNCFIVGLIGCFMDHKFVALNLNSLTMIKYHIFDERVLSSSKSNITSLNVDEQAIQIYRPLSLYAACYNHDVSFWVTEKFSEPMLFLFVESYLKSIVSNVTLIDKYFDTKTSSCSLCYRFIYCGIDYPLSREKARDIHVNFTRPSLEFILGVLLR